MRVEPGGGFFIAESPLVVRTVLDAGRRVRSVLVAPPAGGGPRATCSIMSTRPSTSRRGRSCERSSVSICTAARSRRSIDGPSRIRPRCSPPRTASRCSNASTTTRTSGCCSATRPRSASTPCCSIPSAPIRSTAAPCASRSATCHAAVDAAPAWPAVARCSGRRASPPSRSRPAADARPIDEVEWPDRVALVLGAEGPGLSTAASKAADERVRIPMRAGVDSLNVATAAAIAFYVADGQSTGRSAMTRPSTSSIRRVIATCVEQRPVVRDEQQRAVVGVEGRLELLDRGQVEVVGRLVEHEAVDAAGAEQRERRARALARRQRTARPRSTCSAPSPNFASSERASFGEQPARRARTRRAAARRRRTRPRAWSSSPTTTPGPSHCVRRRRAAAAEQRVEQRRLAAAVRAEDRDPLAVVDLQVDRTEREVAAAHDRAGEPATTAAAARRGRDLHAQLPALPRLVDRVRLEPCSALSVIFALAATCSLLFLLKWRMNLSVSPLFFTLFTPCTDHCRCVCARSVERRALRPVVRVRLFGVAPRGRPLVEIRAPATGVLGRVVRVLVELEHRRDRAVEERPVVRHDHGAAGQLARGTARAVRGPRSRGRSSARRAGTRRSARAGSRRGSRAPPARPRAPASRGRAAAPGGRGRRTTAPTRASKSAAPSAR